MNRHTQNLCNELFSRYPELIVCKTDIEKAYNILFLCHSGNGRIFTCGNGGSAADSDHIVGELMKGFLLKRPLPAESRKRFISEYGAETGAILAENLQQAVPAISLVSQNALSTAFSNDVHPDYVFAQQVYGLFRQNDVLIGLSTSGNSRNVVNAVRVAAVLGGKIIGLTGSGGGLLADSCSVCIRVPETETYKIQELHLPVYHTLCAMLESELFSV